MIYKQAEDNVGELKIYGDIAEWGGITGEDFSAVLAEMETKFKTIRLRVHCYGGSVFEGGVMFNAIRRCKSKVVVFIDGVSASMMSVVMLAADEIIAAENAFIMVHCPTGYQSGNARQMLETARLLANMEKNFAKAYVRKTGKSEKDVQKWFDGADHWFNAEEAKAEGLITAVEAPVIAGIIPLDKPLENGQEKTVFSRFAALYTPNSESKKNDDMKKELITQFNLFPLSENSSEQEIQAAIQSKIDAAAQAEKKQAQQAVDTIIALWEKAKGKNYQQAEREHLITVGLTAGLETLQAMLTLTPLTSSPQEQPPRVLSILSPEDKSDPRKEWDWDKWQSQDPDGYQELEKTDPQRHKDLYNAKFKTQI